VPQVWFLNLGLGSVLFSSNALMSWASTPITFPYPSIPHAIDYPTRIITVLSVAEGSERLSRAQSRSSESKHLSVCNLQHPRHLR